MQQTSYESLWKQKEAAYWERNQLVAALSRIFPSYLTKHPEIDKEWEDDWRTIVVIHIPVALMPKELERRNEYNKKDGVGENWQWHNQLTWHIHDSEVGYFDHLEYGEGTFVWDNHTTEEKYRRLRSFEMKPPVLENTNG